MTSAQPNRQRRWPRARAVRGQRQIRWNQRLQEVSLSVERGEIVTLIGANGAGKTSVLKSVVQLNPMQAATCACSVGT